MFVQRNQPNERILFKSIFFFHFSLLENFDILLSDCLSKPRQTYKATLWPIHKSSVASAMPHPTMTSLVFQSNWMSLCINGKKMGKSVSRIPFFGLFKNLLTAEDWIQGCLKWLHTILWSLDFFLPFHLKEIYRYIKFPPIRRWGKTIHINLKRARIFSRM